MTLLSQDFLASRRQAGRYRHFLVAAGILLMLAGASGGGFYLYQNRAPDRQPQVQGSTISDPDADPDGDLLTNRQEQIIGTDPLKEDTDGDGDSDSYEIAFRHNPLGPGELKFSEDAKKYAEEEIKNNKNLQDFTRDKLYERVKNKFGLDRAVVLDMPDDKDLVVSQDNSQESFEKYYQDTQEIAGAEEQDQQNIEERLFAGQMSAEEIDTLLAKLEAKENLVRQIAVPSELLLIQKYKIATIRAGKKILETVKNNPPKAGQANEQFWTDVFYQVMVAQTAGLAELDKWREVALRLQEQGGLDLSEIPEEFKNNIPHASP